MILLTLYLNWRMAKLSLTAAFPDLLQAPIKTKMLASTNSIFQLYSLLLCQPTNDQIFICASGAFRAKNEHGLRASKLLNKPKIIIFLK